jgi:putative CocE/NonD family hydrolase
VKRDTSFERRQFLALLGLAAAGSVAGCGQFGDGTETATDTLTPATTTDDEEASYETREDVMVEMDDGVSLATNLYLPGGEGPHPTLVNRTPYDKGEQSVVGGVATLTNNGYAVVHQDVRGRYASEGDWRPFFNEGQDGYDTIEWAAEQDWSTGTVGMLGNSYMGITTWQAILADPPSLEAAAPFITPTNYFAHSQYYNGAGEFGLGLFFTGFTSLSTVSRLDVSEEKAQEMRNELLALIQTFRSEAEHLPTEDVPAFDDGVAPFWKEGWRHDTYDEFWKEIDVLQAIEEVSTPVVHGGGWYDIFLRGHTDLYTAIEDRGTDVVRDNQHMVIGPYAHLTFGTGNEVGEKDFGSAPALDLGNDYLVPWFDRWLTEEGDGLASKSPVRYFQMGEDEWRTADTWPPADATETEFYLSSEGSANTRDGDGVLSRDQPGPETPADTYEYDPLDPVETHGGPHLMGDSVPAGVFDQEQTEQREDVLVYTSAELDEAVTVAGPVEASLFVESTAPDTDFVVRLVDVEPSGFAANITDGVVRARYRNSLEETEFMEPGQVYELPVELRPTAHTFQAGHRIRVQVTSSNFPRIDRNPNAAVRVSAATEEDMQTATQTVYHDADRPSHVTLSVR